VGLWVGSDRRPGSGQRLIILTKNHRLWDRHQRHDRHNAPQEPTEHHRLPSSQGPSPHRHANDMDRHRGPETTPETPGVTTGRDGRDDGDDVQARLLDGQVNGAVTPDADDIEVLTL
jgi:hypothetical protein